MMPRSCWALLLLLGAPAGLWGWLGLGDPPEKLRISPGAGTPPEEELLEQPPGGLRPKPETPGPQRPVLDETLASGGHNQVVQLMEDVIEGNLSGRGAAPLRDGRRVVPSDLHHVQERARDVSSQRETDLALLLLQQRQMEEVMEKLRRVNQSLGVTLVAAEGARSRLEKQLQHLHSVLELAAQTPSAISTCVLHGSCFVLLVALLVSTPPRLVVVLLFFLLLLFLGELLVIPALSALLALAVAGQWLVVATRRGAGGTWTTLPREEPRRRLATSTPERDHELELLQEELGRLEMSCLQESSCLEQPLEMAGDLPGLAGWVSPLPGGWRTKLSSSGEMLEPAVDSGKRWEPKPCSLSRCPANDVSLLSSRLPCRGLTRAGQRCRKKATPGQDFCHLHATSCRGLAMDLTPHL